MCEQFIEAKDLDSQETEAYFLLNMDDNLSIYYANSEFYRIFETNSEHFSTLYQNCFGLTWTYHHQMEQKELLSSAFLKDSSYSGDVQVITATGKLKNLMFRLEKQSIGKKGEKLVGSLY
ncbi:MAG: hypothetical protein R3Y63_10575 [Eubacteriales bacterium]